MSRIPSAGPIPQAAPRGGAARDMSDVDLDQFLQLLITQLQNQDPLSPMENSEILEQIGQIREITATNRLTSTLDAVLLGQNVATASSLIGRRVNALAEDGENVEGLVDRVSVEADGGNESKRIIRVHVGQHRIGLNNIREIVGQEAP